MDKLFAQLKKMLTRARVLLCLPVLWVYEIRSCKAQNGVSKRPNAVGRRVREFCSAVKAWGLRDVLTSLTFYMACRRQAEPASTPGVDAHPHGWQEVVEPTGWERLYDALSRDRKTSKAIKPEGTSYAFVWSFGRFLKKNINYVAPLLAACAAAVVILSLPLNDLSLAVYVDGKQFGTVNTPQEYEQALQAAEDQVYQITGEAVTFATAVEFRVTVGNQSSKADGKTLQDNLYALFSADLFEGYGVYVDDVFLGATENIAQVNSFLADNLASYEVEEHENQRVEYLSDIRIVHQQYSTTYRVTAKQIIDVLNSSTQVTSTYQVKRGDTMLGIANSAQMSLNALETLNPNVTPRSLEVGQTLTVTKDVPYLTIQVIRTETYTQAIPYETTYQYSSNYYTDYSYVKVSGKNGTRQVTANVVYVNGEEISRTVLETETLKAPTTAVVLKGSTPVPVRAATGTFMKPVKTGWISSRFGRRDSLSDYHTGMDWAVPIGTPVYAADGGTVSFAGYSDGGFAYLVVIDHGNGLQSYYAHLNYSKGVLVKKGDKVYKGQKIALSGNTGRSTGPHLHFEIRKNGTPVNPAKYLP